MKWTDYHTVNDVLPQSEKGSRPVLSEVPTPALSDPTPEPSSSPHQTADETDEKDQKVVKHILKTGLRFWMKLFPLFILSPGFRVFFTEYFRENQPKMHNKSSEMDGMWSKSGRKAVDHMSSTSDDLLDIFG